MSRSSWCLPGLAAAALALACGAPPPALAQAQSVQTQGQAVDQSAPPPVVDPRTLSEKDRRAYADTLRAARADIERKQYDTAIASLDRLITDHPREPQARFMKGLAQADAGRREDAIATFRALLADFPELPEPRNNLAVLYAQKGEYAQARDELEIALRAAPDYAVAHENLADVYARLAADHYERVVELDKRNKTAPGKLKLAREVTAAAAAP
ncbi:MAG TPA: tetratricopeptide repeat protein [Casimicrobiaceae bacterium]|nr:tetratricopeptide repeat protein [Casimicrobiaceae bacterium]